MNNTITLETVDTVRCKNCTHFEHIGMYGNGYCKVNLCFVNSSSDFCEKGTKSEDIQYIATKYRKAQNENV